MNLSGGKDRGNDRSSSGTGKRTGSDHFTQFPCGKWNYGPATFVVRVLFTQEF